VGVAITKSDHILNSYQGPASGVHSQKTGREGAWTQALSPSHLPKRVPSRIAGGSTLETWCFPGRGRGNRDPDRAAVLDGPGFRGRTLDRREAETGTCGGSSLFHPGALEAMDARFTRSSRGHMVLFGDP
jgi:hypothetical protein